MAEWLRRPTRNQMGSSRAGSNPADCEYILPFFGNIYWWFMIYARLTYITQDFLLILLKCSHGRVVKAYDLKSDEIFPRRFESCWLRVHFAFFSETSVDYSWYMHHWHILNKFFTHLLSCSHGRVVKASDSKSDGMFPRRFESCWLRVHFAFFSETSVDYSGYMHALAYIKQDFNPYCYHAVIAEWLRRLTRNQMGCSRAGSNPADCEDILPFFGNICRLFRIHAPLAYIKQVVYSFVMQSWPSGKGVWLEIRWDLPAQVRILLTASTFCLFRKHLLMIRDTCTIGIY